MFSRNVPKNYRARGPLEVDIINIQRSNQSVTFRASYDKHQRSETREPGIVFSQAKEAEPTYTLHHRYSSTTRLLDEGETEWSENSVYQHAAFDCGELVAKKRSCNERFKRLGRKI